MTIAIAIAGARELELLDRLVQEQACVVGHEPERVQERSPC